MAGRSFGTAPLCVSPLEDLNRAPHRAETTQVTRLQLPDRLRRRRSEDDGFTLAEMLVALGIITGALMALLGGFISSAAAIQAQQEDARAVRVALDRYETLRLRNWATDPELQPGAHSGQSRGSNGLMYSYVTTVVVRDAKPSEDVAGDQVKDLNTVVTWRGRNGRTRDITYRTSIAQDPRTVGLVSGYVQAIQSMTVAPEPSVVVDYDGYTREPVYVTIIMSGFATSDVLTVSWDDGRAGVQTGQAISDDGRYWRLTIPAGNTGIYIQDPQPGVSSTLTFSTTNRIGQTASSDLTVWGPTLNRPEITSFTVSPTPVRTFNGGANRDKNRGDVTARCDVSRMDYTPASTDVVKLRYAGETGDVEVSMRHVAGQTYEQVFPGSTTFFAPGTNPWTCVARRSSDGGMGSAARPVQVGRTTA